jgi:hypothetical protein
MPPSEVIDLIGDEEVAPKSSDKGKELDMEQLYTPRSLENIFSSGDQLILNPLEEVANLELASYS